MDPAILDYYRYSILAAASYVSLDGKPWDPHVVAAEAHRQERLPMPLASWMFAPTSAYSNPSPWHVAYYQGNDAVGFAATLFEGA